MKKLSILFAAFAVMFLVSCGKYEDGPGFSLRSRTSRIAGSWTYEKVLIDGVDVTSTWFEPGEEITLEFTRDGGLTETANDPQGSVSVRNGTWELTDNDENLSVKPLSTSSDIQVSKILRLTNKEMWYVYTSPYSGTTYETHLKAK
jgi:hypothetical protein